MLCCPHADVHKAKMGKVLYCRLMRDLDVVHMETFHNMDSFYIEKDCAKGELPLRCRTLGLRHGVWPNPGH